jgi:thiamine pyrophosphate-dependent acetolactate synthase large subunit-like protein
MEPVVALAERLGCPVITTFKGKGIIADSHPVAGGVLGRSGTPVASWFMNEADLPVVFGASFSNHTGITPKIPTIQVDFDPMILGKFHAVTAPVWGEIGVTARLLSERLEGATVAEDQRSEISERWAIWREEKRRRETEDRGRGIWASSVFAALNRQVPPDAIMPVDVGNNTYSFGRYFECERQSVLMSGYLGSIGFAYPAALGAWAATQEGDPRFHGRPVVSISGDGGFGQYMAELTTAVK